MRWEKLSFVKCRKQGSISFILNAVEVKYDEDKESPSNFSIGTVGKLYREQFQECSYGQEPN